MNNFEPETIMEAAPFKNEPILEVMTFEAAKEAPVCTSPAK